MEDDLNFKVNGRRHQFVMFWKMEDNFNYLAKWKMTSILRIMEDNRNFKVNGKNLNSLVNGRRP